MVKVARPEVQIEKRMDRQRCEYNNQKTPPAVAKKRVEKKPVEKKRVRKKTVGGHKKEEEKHERKITR